MLKCSSFSAFPISICIMPFPPCTALTCGTGPAGAPVFPAAGADSSFPLSASFEAVSVTSFTLSTISLVIGVRASTSHTSVEPITCSIFRPSSLSFRRPASSISSNSDGSSRSAALITSPFCLLQQKIAGSFKCCSSVSFVIDISFPPFFFSIFLLCVSAVLPIVPPVFCLCVDLTDQFMVHCPERSVRTMIDR